jgi:hypothetical protein
MHDYCGAATTMLWADQRVSHAELCLVAALSYPMEMCLSPAASTAASWLGATMLTTSCTATDSGQPQIIHNVYHRSSTNHQVSRADFSILSGHVKLNLCHTAPAAIDRYLLWRGRTAELQRRPFWREF